MYMYIQSICIYNVYVYTMYMYLYICENGNKNRKTALRCIFRFSFFNLDSQIYIYIFLCEMPKKSWKNTGKIKSKLGKKNMYKK